MRVAVTGGTGFIGGRLVEKLLAKGHETRILTRKQGSDDLRLRGARLFQGDLTSKSSLKDFVAGVDVLYHCAGEISRTELMEDLHINGTARLVNAASGEIQKWVQLSSTGAYGFPRAGMISEDQTPQPVGRYETSKLASDNLVAAASANGAFSSVILRPSIVYGAGMPNQSLFAMLRMIERGMFFFIGRPGASANYIHVENVVHALLLCATHSRASGKTFVLSDYCNIEEFVTLMASALGAPIPRRRIPERVIRGATVLLGKLPGWPLTPSRVDALTSFVRYSTKRIEDELDYRHPLSMSEGVADLVRHYRESRIERRA
ncbi:NAD-dependent epimerase/dehydratase family protein [Rhizobium sp. 1399]|uniref:NAD-dependent epimerase/dehydratase family protein n=1 Tax=Rhizobium sp. 1399 TaxID=2817758 RepID=UPI0028553D79|nr:NAD-dependent epimerase/dehydratase family protein [Rhizobium sp. 1399]MDR6671375.1 nucleoside-diphosphate-sugar epimerase [Rhizobium sp. 1399]